MKVEEFEGKNVDQAIEEACRHFNVSPEDLEIEIITHGSTGLFRIGAKKARIRASVKPEVLLRDRKEEAERVLRSFLEAAGLEIEFQGEIKDGKIQFELKGPDREYLLIRGGAPLNALQYLINKVVARRQGVGAKIVFDIEGFRAAREQKLRNMAKKAAQEAKKTRKPVELPPMPSSERRLVHLTLRNFSDIETRSKGQGENRRVVVYPRRRRHHRR
ncbi:MAG: hypothetical protein GXO20_06045 [Thermodesulfobacteria bacterium]|nr:hypothetical protein [Thermodesulfobacteriota bacterium]